MHPDKQPQNNNQAVVVTIFTVSGASTVVLKEIIICKGGCVIYVVKHLKEHQALCDFA